jgi:hypothetical protein
MVDVMSEQTIFEACVSAVSAVPVNGDGTDPREAAVAIIQTIIDLTQSPRTVDELTAILREADAS